MALKKCKECGNEISTEALSCPKCGAVRKKKSGCLSVIFLIILIFIIIGFIGSLNQSPYQTSSVSVSAGERSSKTQLPGTSARPDLEVLDFNWTAGEFGNRVIQGHVRNNTSRQYGYVQVEINLYDNNGTQVGSTLANVNNLEPNATWRFEAPILEDDATKAKIKDVTGF